MIRQMGKVSLGKAFGIALLLLGAIVSFAAAIDPLRVTPGVISSVKKVTLKVASGAEATVSFRIYNNTFRTVGLLGEQGCGCVRLEFEKDSLNPGEMTNCKLVVDPARVSLGNFYEATFTEKISGEKHKIDFVMYQ